MNAVLYYIFYFFNWLLTLLPLRVLYLFSDIVFFFLYHVLKYRKKVVDTNLANSFPEKSQEERELIAKRFYKHLADLMIESLKVAHLSEKEEDFRFTYNNMELIDKLRSENRDIIAVLGHYGNWEFPTRIQEKLKYKIIIIYKPLQNKYFDRFMIKQRSRHGATLTPTSHVIKEIINSRNSNINSLSIFISDQIPSIGDIKYWTKFLNQDTAVFTGAGKIASKYDMAVVFFHIDKLSRGHYNLNMELLFDHPAGLSEEEITEKHVRRLEEIIRQKPEYWIWSHRRWKHKKPATHA